MSQSAIERVRIEVGKKRLRINDRFQDFDKLRSGLVTVDQFRRCLVALNCHLSEADVSGLVQAFPGRLQNTVDYVSFSAEVSREEAPKEMLSSLRSRPRALDRSGEDLVERFNQNVTQRVMASGVDVTTYFKDFDKHRSGLITAPQFERCFPFPVEPATLQALKQRYANDAGLISYFLWCSDIASAVKDAEIARSPPRNAADLSPQRAQSPGWTNPADDASASQLIGNIRQQVFTYKMRCEDTFLDYDKTRVGTVTSGQFCSAVGRMKFVKFFLTHAHLETLAKAYGSVDSAGLLRVNYVAFLADIMPPGTGLGSPKKSAPLVQDAYNVQLNTTLPLVPLAEDEEQSALIVLNKIRKLVATCRISLKPMMHDFDRSIKGVYQTRTCTKARFQRALAFNKIALLPQEMELLCKRYAVGGADGQLTDDINYVVFCRDVEPTEAPYHAGRSHTALLPVGDGLQIADTVESVMQKLAQQVANRKIRLTEFFRDFDPLRAGTIQKDKFASAITIAGIRLAESEVALLIQAYRSDRVVGHVEINRLVADVDKAAESASSMAVLSGSYSSGSLRSVLGSSSAASSPAAPLTDADLTTLRNVISRLSEHVKHHGLLLPPFFVDYDRHHTGRITKTQFLQTLSRHKLPISADDANILIRAYGDSVNLDMVLYRSFIGDVDDAENVALQLTQRIASRRPLPSAPGEVPFQASTTLIESTLNKVTNFVMRKGVRLEEFFQDADSLRHRCITACRFRGALSVMGIALAEEELKALESAFSTPRIMDGVDYVAFVADVQKRVASTVPAATLAATSGSSTTATGEAILETIRRTFAARRLSLRTTIQDFDKLRKGTVTKAQFFSCLTSNGIRLEPREIATLSSIYGAGDGLIAFHRFCDAVDVAK